MARTPPVSAPLHHGGREYSPSTHHWQDLMRAMKQRPAPFRREDESEENYLVVMHYLAEMLWQEGKAVQAMESLRKVVEGQSGTAE